MDVSIIEPLPLLDNSTPFVMSSKSEDLGNGMQVFSITAEVLTPARHVPTQDEVCQILQRAAREINNSAYKIVL